MIIYFAAPLFSIAEREFNDKLAKSILNNLKNVEIILPQKDSIKAMKSKEPFKTMFSTCLNSIKKADIIIAILDGSDVDSGTSFEVGFAYALKKPIIGVRSDFRDSEDRGVNLMLSRSMNTMIILKDKKITSENLAFKIVEIIKNLNHKNKKLY